MQKRKIRVSTIFLHFFFILVTLCFLIPMVMVISISLSSEAWVNSGGYSLIPHEFSLSAYKLAFGNPRQILSAYGVTISESVLGTVLSMVVAGMVAYPLSRSNFRFKTPIMGFIFFTMLFSAGMIPSYITLTKYYHLGNSFWIYIIPGMTGGAWNTLVFRTFFKGLPESLFEAARIDGAKELYIFFRIVLPLSTPVFATLGFRTLVERWNNYTTSMIYIRDESLYTLQYLLQRILNEADYLSKMAQEGNVVIDIGDQKMPAETLKYALCVIAAGPMLLVFPFFQKYFSQGLTIGAVKG